MAAPVPAPLPPPAMAPPAAPTAAPAIAPIPASLAVSRVLSRWPACAAACWLQASIAACVGTGGVAGVAGAVAERVGLGPDDVARAAEVAVRGAVLAVASASFFTASFPLQFATTSPVASAVAPTRINARLVSFQGLFQPLFVIAMALLSGRSLCVVTQGSRNCAGEGPPLRGAGISRRTSSR